MKNDLATEGNVMELFKVQMYGELGYVMFMAANGAAATKIAYWLARAIPKSKSFRVQQVGGKGATFDGALHE